MKARKTLRVRNMEKQEERRKKFAELKLKFPPFKSEYNFEHYKNKQNDYMVFRRWIRKIKVPLCEFHEVNKD